MRHLAIACVGVGALLVAACSSTKSNGACPEGAFPQGKAPPDGTVTWCARSDGTKHGPWKEWYPDGSLKSEGQFVDGKMDGEWVTYHEPAPKADEAAEGEHAEAEHAEGEHAEAEHAEAEHAAKVTDEATAPRKKEQGAYKGGLKTGVWTLWGTDGKKTREATHTIGQDEVPWTVFRPDGKTWAKGTTVAMREHGAYSEWHANGQLAAEGTYDSGEKVGEWKYYDPDGNPVAEYVGDFSQ